MRGPCRLSDVHPQVKVGFSVAFSGPEARLRAHPAQVHLCARAALPEGLKGL